MHGLLRVELHQEDPPGAGGGDALEPSDPSKASMVSIGHHQGRDFLLRSAQIAGDDLELRAFLHVRSDRMHRVLRASLLGVDLVQELQLALATRRKLLAGQVDRILVQLHPRFPARCLVHGVLLRRQHQVGRSVDVVPLPKNLLVRDLQHLARQVLPLLVAQHIIWGPTLLAPRLVSVGFVSPLSWLLIQQRLRSIHQGRCVLCVLVHRSEDLGRSRRLVRDTARARQHRLVGPLLVRGLMQLPLVSPLSSASPSSSTASSSASGHLQAPSTPPAAAARRQPPTNAPPPPPRIPRPSQALCAWTPSAWALPSFDPHRPRHHRWH